MLIQFFHNLQFSGWVLNFFLIVSTPLSGLSVWSKLGCYYQHCTTRNFPLDILPMPDLNWNNAHDNNFCIWLLLCCGNCVISKIIGNLLFSILSSTAISFDLIFGNISMYSSWVISFATSATQPLITRLDIVSWFHWLQTSLVKFLLSIEANLISQSLFQKERAFVKQVISSIINAVCYLVCMM